jgi:hypothetical protein
MLSCDSGPVNGRDDSLPDGAVWDYPVKPGSAEWKKFKSHEEMAEACRIPEHILPSLSTEELTELCLRYPLLNDVFAFNSLNDGLDRLFDDFNGIGALLDRKDASKNLTVQYALKIRDCSFLDSDASDAEKGEFVISISAPEVLLSRAGTNEGGENDWREILQSLVSGYEAKCRYADYFTGQGLRTNFYARAWTIKKLDGAGIESLPGKDRNAVFFSGMADEQTADVINRLSYAKIFINN